MKTAPGPLYSLVLKLTQPILPVPPHEHRSVVPRSFPEPLGVSALQIWLQNSLKAAVSCV